MSAALAKHLRVAKGDLGADVVVCGDPARAARIASFLDDARTVAQNREYHSFVGTFHGKQIAAVSHGVGSSGAAICFHELIDSGAERLVRVGTAGSLQEQLRAGDIVLPIAAVRLDGTSQMMVPPEFPAVADVSLFERLRASAARSAAAVPTGIVLSSALFYSSLLPDNLSLYRDAGVLAVEMEVATLYVVGSIRRVATASILVIDGSPLHWAEGDYHAGSSGVAQATDRAILAALEALAAD